MDSVPAPRSSRNYGHPLNCLCTACNSARQRTEARDEGTETFYGATYRRRPRNEPLASALRPSAHAPLDSDGRAMHPSPSAPTVRGRGVDPDALDETRRDAMAAQTAVPQYTAHSRSSGRLRRVLGTVCGLAIAAVGLGLIGGAAGGLVVPASVTTTTPPAAALHSRSSPLAHIKSPVSALVTPPCVLHNRDWARVNLKPRRYIGCRVDVAGNMYSLQVMDGYVSYDTNLDPNGSHDWDVFAHDDADNPPSIAENSYVEITGKIAAASAAYSSLSGGFLGYVPQIQVVSIRHITARAAFRLGMAAS